jgi:hypothetical protein
MTYPILLLNAMQRPVRLHNRVYIRFDPLLGGIEVHYIAVLGRFGTQKAALWSSRNGYEYRLLML